ncbi:MAG: hypothetical protein KatS3mg061_1278 [Dehalococcoidia bacterium]|nr:MAG: hypothetical protein KatS3mg061_1278 [Dehalococcoidia bacterium]
MDVAIGSAVYCRDGQVGTVERVVISPRRREVTDLIVATGGLLHRDLVVPIERVARIEDGRVVLDLSAEEVRELPVYLEASYVAPDPTWRPLPAYSSTQVVLSTDPLGAAQATERPALVGWVQQRVRPGLPEEAVVLRRGMPVECRSGRLGVVDQVLLDPEERTVTHVVVRRGTLLSRDVIIPLEWVTAITENGIFVEASREQVERLPEFRPRHSDAEIAEAVRRALAADQRTSREPIQVEVHQGVVTLLGRVVDRAARLAASAVTRAVPGVLATENRLAVGAKTTLDTRTGLEFGWVAEAVHRAAGVVVDEQLATAIVQFAERKLCELIEVAEETMLANGRERLLWHDLPLPLGLRQSLREYEAVSHDLSGEMVEGLVRDAGVRAYLDERVREQLPKLFGTIIMLTARATSLVSPASVPPAERVAWLAQAEAGQPREGDFARACQLVGLVL